MSPVFVIVAFQPVAVISTIYDKNTSTVKVLPNSPKF